ncbi:MAG: glycosyltransferase family 39 protein [Candidatus Levybacteria bacterium]|nr:glycosyltransferase family 39 protein [Candidatus Levybacteria bacterium]
MKRLFLKIYNSKHFNGYQHYWFLLGICAVFAFLRLPSLVEPHWYGDEGIYQVVGRALNDGRVLYRDIWDNKPPLLYIIYAFLQGNLFAVKLFSLISGLLSIIVFFLLSLRIFKKNHSVYVATTVFALLLGLPIIEGNIANAENFMLLPIVTGGYFIYLYTKNKYTLQLVTAGILLSIAFIIKTVAIFDFVAFFVFLFLIFFTENKLRLKISFVMLASFLSLFLICCLYFFALGAFQDFMDGVFTQNIGYVSEQYGAANPRIILLIKTIILAAIVGAIFFLRKKITKSALFIYIWVAFGSYSVLFSDRPYTHYLIVLLPAFSLLLGHSLERSRVRFFELVLIIVIALSAYFHFQLYRKNIAYYRNYIEFITNRKEIRDYQSFFDRNTPRDYKIANFIRTNVGKNEEVFLISDSVQIYALSDKLPIGKYLAAYHISYYKDGLKITKEQIEKVRPRYIIQTTAGSVFDELLSSYDLRYIMEGTKIYERQI